MTRTQLRRVGSIAAVSLLIAMAATPLAVVAADDPVGAVEDVFAAIDEADFEALESLVCEAERESVREAFDPFAQLGLTAGEFGGSLTLRFDDRTVELVSEEAESATVRITGTMVIDLQTDDLEGFLRAMLEAEMGEDASEEDIEAMLPFMETAFNQTLPLDEEVEVIREEGEWLMCGDIDGGSDEPDVQPSVSADGLCGFVAPDELDSLSELTYDSSNGFESYCSYSNSDYDDYHSTTVTFESGEVEQIGGFFGADQPLEVGGLPAVSSGPEAFGNELFTQLGEGVLHVSVVLPESPPEGFDWLAHAVAVTELFVPHAEDIALTLAGPVEEVYTPPPTPSVSICELVTLEAINEATGLSLDEASGDGWYCGYYSLDGDPGFHSLNLSLTELTLSDYGEFVPGATETTIGGAAALEAPGQLLVELADPSYVLMVSGFLDPSDESVTLTDAELLRLVAELAVPLVVPPGS